MSDVISLLDICEKDNQWEHLEMPSEKGCGHIKKKTGFKKKKKMTSKVFKGIFTGDILNNGITDLLYSTDGKCV